MRPRSRILLLATLAALLAPTMPDLGQAVGWRQAVDRLAREKNLAEGCASLLKAFADDAPMARVQGQRLYARAKSDMDGLIERFIADLTSERPLTDAPDIRHRVEAIVTQRQALCRQVDAVVGTALRQQGARTSAADLLAEGSGDALPPLFEAAVQIWQAYRAADEASRATIVARLEAARWPAYGGIPAAYDGAAGRRSSSRPQPCVPNRPRGRQNRTAAISR
jgi:hypothetical protein